MKRYENERKPRGRGTTTTIITIIIIITTPFLVGRPTLRKWCSNLALCGRSGLGEKKTLNTGVVGITRVGA